MAFKIKFFTKIGKTRIFPIGVKVLIVFICLILFSNIGTNIISIQMTNREIIKLSNTIMVNQLKELYNNASNQFQIFSYSNNELESIESMNKVALANFSYPNSVAFGLKKDGTINFLASNNSNINWIKFFDTTKLQEINNQNKNGIAEGSISFSTPNGEYFGVYKYHSNWNYYIIRADLRSDLNKSNLRIFIYLGLMVFVLTIVFIIIGFIILKHEFKMVNSFTNDLISMQQKKRLELIDISKAPNDDVTYMAASFNALTMQVNSLLGTFQKFVSKDIVAKAYSGQNVGLEGNQQELAMLFSDVKSFTYRTETLGNDIIEVLNVHYNRVIHNVHDNNGIIGSIVGDAILAIYGTLNSQMSKSYNAIRSAWDITRSTEKLRKVMLERREIIEKNRKLTESEEKVFKAVLVDVGVGVDGGNVFYGTIGRNDFSDPLQAHMTNTVIGDTVNSASRLEGLTRIYHIPIIVSEYIKDEVLKESARYKFFEVDTVQVKGKTEGKKVYFPFDTNEMDDSLLVRYAKFEDGLKAYYEGDWKTARKVFKETELDITQVFLERMGMKSAPEDWSGIWTMTTK